MMYEAQILLQLQFPFRRTRNCDWDKHFGLRPALRWVLTTYDVYSVHVCIVSYSCALTVRSTAHTYTHVCTVWGTYITYMKTKAPLKSYKEVLSCM